MKTLRSCLSLVIVVALLLCLSGAMLAQTATTATCPLHASLTAWPANTPLVSVVPTVTPTLGTATAWGYKIVAKNAAGAVGAAEGTTAAGAATLDVTHYNTITWAAVAGETAGFDVYRTTVGTAPTTLGKIGSVAHAATKSLVDNALVGDGTAVPTTDTTGAVQVVAAPTASTIPVYINNVATARSVGGAIVVCGAWIRVSQGVSAAAYALVAGGGTNCSTGRTALTPHWFGTASVIDKSEFLFMADAALMVPGGNALCLDLDKVPTGAVIEVNYGIRAR